MNKSLAKKLLVGDQVCLKVCHLICTVDSLPTEIIPADNFHKETVLVRVTVDNSVGLGHYLRKMCVSHRSLSITDQDTLETIKNR